MAEKLASLRKYGGNMNIATPDIISNADMATHTSRNVAVSKMPKTVIVIFVSTNGGFVYVAYDVKSNKWVRTYYNSSYVTDSGDGLPPQLTAVTSTYVTVYNTGNVTYRTSAIVY